MKAGVRCGNGGGNIINENDNEKLINSEKRS